MLDEQTRRSVESMCMCGLDLDGLKGCFPKVDEKELKVIYEAVRNNCSEDSDIDITISCNCS